MDTLATINIGHGDPTIFREWWEQTEIFPDVDTRSTFFYEYHETDHHELMCNTHKFHSLFGTDSPSSQLVYGNGSTQVIHAALYAISKKLSRPIVVGYEPPVYMLMHEFLSHCNFVSVTFDLTRADIDVEIVIDPNNPSGEHRIHKSTAQYIIFDRAYNWPIYVDNLTPTSNAPNHITVYTLSKCLGMGGLRLGWAFINDQSLTKEIKRALFVIGICPNSFSLHVACAIFNRFITDPTTLTKYELLRNTIADRRSQVSKVLTVTNSSGPYAWIKSDDGSDIAEYLLNKYNIKVYPGKEFATTADYARFSLICSSEEFNNTIQRLQSK